jgi:predicted DNA-binding transcriptional regulator AlpA
MARHATALAPKSPRTTLNERETDRRAKQRAISLETTDRAEQHAMLLLSTTEVCAIFKCHYTTLWRRLKTDKTFPRPILLSVKRLAWYESEILAYLKSRPRVETSAYSK